MLRTGRLLNRVLTALVVGTAAGCAATIPVPPTVDVAGMPNPEAALQKSMGKVDAEMSQLGTVSSSPRLAAQQLAPAPVERLVDLTWSGPLDAGVAQLAQSVGYTFFTTKPPSVPGVNVSVDVRGVSALDAFRSLGERAGSAATVIVDPLHHSVQVTHHA